MEISKDESNIINYKEKIEAMDELLKKDMFSNPIKEIQIKHRMELLEYKEVLESDMLNLESQLVYNKLNF